MSGDIDGFTPIAVDGVRWPVYRSDTTPGPPVVLIHELFGLTDPVAALGRRLVASGFTVYLPVLAGPAPARGAGRYVAAAGICVSREINVLRTGRTSKAVGPLKTLARYAAKEAGTKGAGVIGMCFSGGFALAVACDEHVLAGVAAQPSLPFPVLPVCARDLGMDGDDITTLRRRLAAGETEVYVTRFSADWMSPQAREDSIRTVLGPQGVTIDTVPSGPGNEYEFGRGDHSVLSLAPAKHASDKDAKERLDETFDAVVAFLRRRVR